MRESRPELFRGRHFRDEIILLWVRWYLRYPLSYRNLEEMMAERVGRGSSMKLMCGSRTVGLFISSDRLSR
jgi:hypothetical protein